MISMILIIDFFIDKLFVMAILVDISKLEDLNREAFISILGLQFSHEQSDLLRYQDTG